MLSTGISRTYSSPSYTGSSGIGALLANTLAVRNVTVAVLDVNPIVTENCRFFSHSAIVHLRNLVIYS